MQRSGYRSATRVQRGRDAAAWCGPPLVAAPLLHLLPTDTASFDAAAAVQEELFMRFAEFEERVKEPERAR